MKKCTRRYPSTCLRQGYGRHGKFSRQVFTAELDEASGRAQIVQVGDYDILCYTTK